MTTIPKKVINELKDLSTNFKIIVEHQGHVPKEKAIGKYIKLTQFRKSKALITPVKI